MNHIERPRGWSFDGFYCTKGQIFPPFKNKGKKYLFKVHSIIAQYRDDVLLQCTVYLIGVDKEKEEYGKPFPWKCSSQGQLLVADIDFSMCKACA